MNNEVKALNPQYSGMRVRDVQDLFPKAFSAHELAGAYRDLTWSLEDERLILEAAPFEDVDSYYNPGNEAVTDDFILEAITVDRFSRTEKRMGAVVRVLNKHLEGGEIQALDPIVGRPKKSGTFAYVTVQLPFSDGQSVSVVFHSPEGDKKKIGPDDQIIAFRWLLNKRDITHTVAPEDGAEVSLDTIAVRITQLVVKNSARFSTQQKDAFEEVKGLKAAREALDAATEQKLALADRVLATQKEYDTIAAKAANTKRAIEKQQQINADLEGKIAEAKAKRVTKPVVATNGESASRSVQDIDAEISVLKKSLKAEASAIEAYNNTNNEGGEGFNPHLDKHDEILSKIVALKVERFWADWTVENYISRREAWNAEINTLKTSKPSPSRKDIDAIEVKLGFTFEDLKNAKARYGENPQLHQTEKPVVATNGESSGEPFNPTSPEGYAKVLADESLQLKYQDQLDAFFQERAVLVLSALRKRGWEGEVEGALSKGGHELVMNFKHVGAGKNVVGMSYEIKGVPGFFMSETLVNDHVLMAERIDLGLTNAIGKDSQPLAGKDDPINGTSVYNLNRGDVLKDSYDNLYSFWDKRNDVMEVFPIVEGKPEINADSSVYVNLTDGARERNKKYRSDPFYLVRDAGEKQPDPASTEKPDVPILPSKEQDKNPAKRVSKLLYAHGFQETVMKPGFHAVLKKEPFEDLSIETHAAEDGKVDIFFTQYVNMGGDMVIDSEIMFRTSPKSGYLKQFQTAGRGPAGEFRGNDTAFGNIITKNLIDQGFMTATVGDKVSVGEKTVEPEPEVQPEQTTTPDTDPQPDPHRGEDGDNVTRPDPDNQPTTGVDPSPGDTVYFFHEGKQEYVAANYRGTIDGKSTVVYLGSNWTLERKDVLTEAQAKLTPDLEVMVKEAARWRGAAMKKAHTLSGDKKMALKLSNMTTKHDLDAYLMRKFGVDVSTAHDVSNTLTARNVPDDMTAEIQDYANEPWAQLEAAVTGPTFTDHELSIFKSAVQVASGDDPLALRVSDVYRAFGEVKNAGANTDNFKAWLLSWNLSERVAQEIEDVSQEMNQPEKTPEPQPEPTPVEPAAPAEPAAVGILNAIVAGEYDNDAKALDAALDGAAAELDAAGLMETYDGILNQAADRMTMLLKKRAAEVM